MKGIDISMHNQTINFASVKSDGVQAVVIKATEGVQYVDPLYEEYYYGASGEGLNVGFYHFMSEKTSPTEQAIDFYDAINGKGYNIIPVLDIESNNYGRNATQVTNRCLEFLDKFKELTGIDCIIYTYLSFANDYLDSRLGSYLCWIAHYGVATPGVTDVWGTNYVGHQYTDTGHISGVNGYVDLNNFTEGILLNNDTSNDRNATLGIVTADVLNVRETPGGTIIGQLTNGSIVKIDREDGDWYSIFYGEHGGYVSKDYVSTNQDKGIDGALAIVTASVLNVRDSIMGNIIGKLYKGDTVKLFKQENGWYEIYFGDHGGWVSGDYLRV